ncbi:MAG: hypothetical protein WCF12_14330 [Propionicimonas sp.]
MVAKSSAERQAAYRARQGRRAQAVQLWLADSDKGALRRLARHRAMSQAELVAALLRQAETEATAGMDDGQIDDYFDTSRRAPFAGSLGVPDCQRVTE